MKKNIAVRVLSVFLCMAFILGAVNISAFATPAEDAHLHFNDDGKFRIINFSDIQDDATLDSRTKSFLRQAVLYNSPDIIVLTGDNIYGPEVKTAANARSAIGKFMSVFEELGVPVAIVFGNHDDQDCISKEDQMAIYNSYSVSISYDEGTSMAGCGTYNVPIYSSTNSNKVAFNLWMFDTGSSQNISGYDYMRDNQLNWYRSKANELKAQNGGVRVPSIAFQHIIVKEIYNALKQVSSGTSGAQSYNGKYYVLPDNAAPGSVLNEHPCPSNHTGEFDAVAAQGDVLAIVSGHDHENSFIVPYRGIDLINTPTCGF
ncbi:MAG: metallophosphoesterase, partial [Clostridiales bacterium]|nr:metallophosphoesterase [Clostridiales bacterium]